MSQLPANRRALAELSDTVHSAAYSRTKEPLSGDLAVATVLAPPVGEASSARAPVRVDGNDISPASSQSMLATVFGTEC